MSASAGRITRIAESSVASAATIVPKTDTIIVTGVVDIANITPPMGTITGVQLMIIPVDGAVNLLNTGNIAVAVTMAQNRVTVLVYSKVKNKWYPGAIS